MAANESYESQYLWDACHRNLWKESVLWTQFAQHWRTQNVSYDTTPNLTLVPELQEDLILVNMFQVLMHNKEILVLEQYRIMIQWIFERYNDAVEGDSGCVITGQPGVGKSVLLCLLLVVLLQSKTPTPIVFYHDSARILFFESRAYIERDKGSFEMVTVPLPKRRQEHSEVMIPRTWVLVDMGISAEEPKLDVFGYIFPVQSASPNPAQYHKWTSMFRAIKWALPLWTRDQIHNGWTTQYKYPFFRARILDWMNNKITEIHTYRYSDHTNLVQTHREQCKMEPHTSVCVDGVITKCVDQAIELFGYSPRDVYGFLINPSETKSQHNSAVANALVSWTSIAEFMERLDSTGEAETFSLDPRGVGAHRIVALDVPDFENGRNTSVYVWKSSFIQEAMMANFSKLKEEEQARCFRILQTSAKSSVIAGPIYKQRAHEFFTFAEKRFLPLQPMHKLESDDDKSSSSADNKHPPPLTYVTTTDPAAFYPELPSRLELLEYDLNLDGLPIIERCYYKPNYASHPLFDSFIIEKSNGLVILDVIQFGLPDTKGAAASGYSIIGKLRDLAKRKFGLPVCIRYIYANSELLPDRVPKYWKLPRTGFIEGEVWYLGLPYPFEREKFQEARRVLESRQRRKELDQMQE